VPQREMKVVINSRSDLFRYVAAHSRVLELPDTRENQSCLSGGAINHCGIGLSWGSVYIVASLLSTPETIQIS